MLTIYVINEKYCILIPNRNWFINIRFLLNHSNQLPKSVFIMSLVFKNKKIIPDYCI